jgi:hypothetical protein
MIACHGEPTLGEILSDPVIEAVMEADGSIPVKSRPCCAASTQRGWRMHKVSALCTGG